jgi:hypothetical protein
MTEQELQAMILKLQAENQALKAKVEKPEKKVTPTFRLKIGHIPKSGERAGIPQCYLLVGKGRMTTYLHLNAGTELTDEGREKLNSFKAEMAAIE